MTIEKKTKKKFRLTKLRINEISLCINPAVPAARFAVIKSLIESDASRSFDWNDDAQVQALQDCIENLTSAQLEEAKSALGSLSVRLDEMVKKSWLTKLKAQSPATFSHLADNSNQYEWNGLAFVLKEIYKTKPVKNLTKTGSHYFDAESCRWLPTGRKKYVQEINDLGQCRWVPNTKED